MGEMSEKSIPPATLKILSEIVAYPVLLEHEESLRESILYDVSAWLLYLSQVDEILSALHDAITASSQQKRNKGSYSTTIIGGRTINIQDLANTHHLLQQARNLISERSLHLLPGSYKLWYQHLTFLSTIYIQHNYALASSSRAQRYKNTVSVYERSLVRMNKYPRIWLSFISFILHHDISCSVTNIRRLFNRALLALPATQHDLIWSEYLCFILKKEPPKGLFTQSGKDLGPVTTSYQIGTFESEDYPWNIPHETVLRVLRRYAHYYDPAARELLASVALQFERYGEAAALYCDVLNDPDFLSVSGTTRHELWLQFTDVCTEHPDESREGGVDFEGIVRGVLKPSEAIGSGWEVFDKTREDDGIEDDEEQRRKSIKDQQVQLQASLGELEGTLWNKLALYHIRSGEFELAQSIYEEAMESVSRVRDFSLIFDAYVKFEENVIEALMEKMDEGDEDKAGEDNFQEGGTSSDLSGDEDMDILLGKAVVSFNEGEENISADIELALARAENLMNRRPLLLNYVLLRQNPQNVGEWLKRSELYLKIQQPSQSIASLEEAVNTVSARQAMNGSPADLYKSLANLYEEEFKDIPKACSVYERICTTKPEYRFRDPDDLAQCYAAWIEMELRVENWDGALSVARRSVAHAPGGSSKVIRGLCRSMRLWNLMLDLEESIGTLQTTKDAYNRLLELKAATPTQVLNFAHYLSEQKYYEESFSAYERGLDMFMFPHPGAKKLWKEYLQSFQQRYGGSKIHRTRELFDRCLDSCPAEDASEFFLQYGKFEENFGLTKRALGVYEKMCTIVPSEDKYTAYQLYIAKTMKYIGITATRTIYERAIPALEDTPAAKMCLDYAKMEASLQEIDRARTAYTFGAQLADPRANPEYWGEWHEFEVSHGNEETFREMLRVKRGVQTAFSAMNYNTSQTDPSKTDTPLTHEEAIAILAAQEGEGEIETVEKEKIGGFVKAKRPAEVKDLGEIERRAAKLRKVTAGLIAANQNEEEIDID